MVPPDIAAHVRFNEKRLTKLSMKVKKLGKAGVRIKNPGSNQ
jgi:hypothetical protein